MARKLSKMKWCTASTVLVAGAAFAVQRARAEGDVQVTQPNTVVENPFVASQPKPRIASEEPQSTDRGPITYQNPFANASKAPPIDTSIRPGPISRWQHPIIPRSEPSVIKAAVLDQPMPRPAEPAHMAWDQLPPAERLRQAQAEQNGTDHAVLHQLTGPSPIIHSTPTPLAQPTWIAPTASEANPLDSPLPLIASSESNDSPLSIPSACTAGPDLSPASQPKATGAIANNHTDQAAFPAIHADTLPTFVSDCEDSPESWLAQSQDAASKAESSEQLTAVIELCDRGLHGKPSAKLLSSLRRLAAWAHNRRGEIYADAQRSDDAIHDFQTAISLDPNCSLAIHNRAVTLAQRNQYAAALRDFNRVIELNPGLAIAYRNRAELLAALGRMDEAIADYNEAILSLPEDASLLRARAHAYQRLGDFAHATNDIDRAIQLSPNDPESLTQRGNLAADQGKFEQAQEDFRKAIAVDSNWADAYRSLAWLQATCPDPHFRDVKQALTSADHATEMSSPDDYQVLDTLAAANAAAGHFEKAVEIQKKAIAAAPRDISTPLEERLALYQHRKAFAETPAKGKVRTVSHEATVTPRPSPESQQAPR